ncbi:MAG: SDR family oxidoreductase [Paracoccaceae bacterium]|nr:SDR family oxidoreductase [Paracoccaceae bacterium]MDG2258237.1 SDR family oxidoreductase [Paracoccaceae bacterium]
MTRQNTHRVRTLVTGGAGFIGSHLCDRLIATGHHVVCADNLLTGSYANIDHLIGNPQFEFLHHDVTNPLFIEVDEIYNLACPASPQHYQHDPVKTIKTSVHGSINLLGLAKRLKCRILQASTSEVYGDPLIHPQPEGYWGNVNPVGLRSCYDEGKRCAETLFFDYHRQHDVDIKIARIFNTYGPRMQPDDGRVVSNFIVQALQGKDITIHGSGAQSRTFCYVMDLVSGLINLMHTPATFTGPVNLGSEQQSSMLELAQMVLSLTKSRSKLVFMKRPADDPCRRQPDLQLARAVLGWDQTIPLPEGLRATIEYFRSNLSDQTQLDAQTAVCQPCQ